ncbi:30S ribosomal protein S8 [Candidatus Saccharibacteria bacterium]|nr:30S ribosomal protein S8 [Candidatus Saccharibacteria bacterium]
MMTTDPIADMLTRIRNALNASRSEVLIPYSKIKLAIAEILVGQGYIAKAELDKSGAFQMIKISLSVNEGAKSITKIQRVSKPGRRIYAKFSEIPQVLNGRGVVIVSTSSGLMTGKDARSKGLGGELICKVY